MTATMYSSHESEIEPYNVLSVETGSIRCQEHMCNFRSHRIKQLRQHLVSAHNFKIQSTTMYFNHIKQFDEWKESYEQENHFTYYLLSTKQQRTHNYYYCSLGKQRHTKHGNHRRITNHCIASIVVKINRNTGQVYMEMVDQHYGHDNPMAMPFKASLLTKEERNELRRLLEMGCDKQMVNDELSFKKIPDKKKKLMIKEFDRMRFYQIYRGAECNYNEETSFDDWLQLFDENEKNGIIIHKPKGLLVECPKESKTSVMYNTYGLELLEADDFVLGVMSASQQRLLMEYGSTLIMERVTPTISSRDGEAVYVLYLMVLNQLGHEMHVGFCVTNTPNLLPVKSYFLAIKEVCGNISPELVIVNDLDSVYTYWLEVFHAKVPTRLISPWFVEAQFSEVLGNCGFESPTVENIQEQFRSLLLSIEPTSFRESLQTVIKSFVETPSALKLLNHISETLLQRCNDWALCYFSKYRSEINQCMNTLNNLSLQRLHNFTKRRIGRCVYLILQHQRNKKTRSKVFGEAPGKRPNPEADAPSLDKDLHNTAEQSSFTSDYIHKKMCKTPQQNVRHKTEIVAVNNGRRRLTTPLYVEHDLNSPPEHDICGSGNDGDDSSHSQDEQAFNAFAVSACEKLIEKVKYVNTNGLQKLAEELKRIYLLYDFCSDEVDSDTDCILKRELEQSDDVLDNSTKLEGNSSVQEETKSTTCQDLSRRKLKCKRTRGRPITLSSMSASNCGSYSSSSYSSSCDENSSKKIVVKPAKKTRSNVRLTNSFKVKPQANILRIFPEIPSFTGRIKQSTFANCVKDSNDRDLLGKSRVKIESPDASPDAVLWLEESSVLKCGHSVYDSVYPWHDEETLNIPIKSEHCLESTQESDVDYLILEVDHQESNALPPVSHSGDAVIPRQVEMLLESNS